MGKGVKQGPSILEQSRDIYGFAVRPQHLQRYREYASIYQEEEAERAERWELFLRTYCQHGQAVLASSAGTSTGQNFENGSQKLDSANSLPGSCDLTKNEVDLVGRPDYNDAGKQPNGNHRTVQTWSSVRPSLKILGQALNNQLENSLYFNERKSSIVTEVESELFTESGDKKVNVLNSGPIHNVIEEKFNKALSEAESVKSESVDFSIPGNQINDKEFAKEKTASVCFPEQSLSEEVHILVSAESNLKEESSVPEEASAARDELKFLVRGGVPMALRGELWQVFVGTAARRIEGHYDVLLNGSIDVGSSTSGVIEKWTSQIEKDLPRTFPGHPALDKDGRNALRRLLTAYARHNPDVGYCQAMNFFAALLLLLMPEENAFWTLTCIIDDYFEGYFTERMLEAQVDQLVLQELVHEYFPKLMTHLEALGVQVAWISGPWFLSIFVNMLPWESVLRVWDVLLFEGNRCMLFYTALALMELHAPFIMATHDVGDALSLLQSRTASTFDSSQLVLTACMGFQEVDEAKVDALRLKHRPQVLATIDERAMELHLRKNSQDSISKKFSQTVINEPTAEGNNTHSHSNKFEKKEGSPDSLSECAELNGTLHFDSIHANTGVPLQIALKDTECDLKKQVLWLQGELQRALKEKKNALSRAEELETALMELVKEDNRRLLSAKLEKLEEEVAALSQALLEKQVQEEAFLQTISQLEQEQAICKDAQRNAEQDAAAQRYAANLLQEKYEEAAEALEKMEQRAIMAESVLEATLQYQAMDGAHATHRGVVLSSTRGDHLSKANCHLKPNSTEPHPQGKHDPRDLACDPNLRSANSNYDQFEEPATRKQGMFSRAFGLNWGDRSKVH